MKKTSMFGLFCMSAVLGVALVGGPSAQSEESSAQSTNLAPASATNAPQGNTLRTGVDPNSALAKLTRLVQAGVEEDVILAYIDNTLHLFQLDADDIIYLTDLGTPGEVIKAAMAHDERLIQKGISQESVSEEPAPLEEVVETIEEPLPEVSEADFYERLSPYGAWVDVDGYGRCWRPTVAVYNTGWQPYCDNGRWVYTTHGWYWKSGYSWGSAAFHYGRWFRHSRHGWCWWPDTVWAPSWVCWRYDRSYCGWAPLPPHTGYRSGGGFFYRDNRVVVGFDFGLNVSSFTFVATRNFYDPKPWHHRIGAGEATRIYSRTTVFNNITYNQKGQTIINSGIPHKDISTASRKEIRPVSINHAKGRVVRGKPHERVDPNGRALVANRPSPVSTKKPAPTTMRRNVQQPNRPEGHGGTSKSWSSKPTPQPPLRQAPRVTPRSQERNKVAPPKNNSNGPARKQVQNNHSKPQPKVTQPRPVKKPAPAVNRPRPVSPKTPAPRVTPRPQERNKVVPPQNNSKSPARKQVQNNRPKPQPKVTQPRPVKKPAPAKLTKAKGKGQQKPQKGDGSQ